VRDRADAQKARHVVRRVPGRLEVEVLCRVALAEIEEEAAVLVLDEDLVAADLAVAAMDSNGYGHSIPSCRRGHPAGHLDATSVAFGGGFTKAVTGTRSDGRRKVAVGFTG